MSGENRLLFSGLPNLHKISSLFGFLQSYGCPHGPPHQPLKLFFSRLSPWFVNTNFTRSLPPETTCNAHKQNFKVMAPRPSVSPTTCLRKSRALHRDITDVDVSRIHIFRHTVSRTPPETTNSSVLLFKSSFNPAISKWLNIQPSSSAPLHLLLLHASN